MVLFDYMRALVNHIDMKWVTAIIFLFFYGTSSATDIDIVGLSMGICTPDLKNSKDPSGAEIVEFEWFQSIGDNKDMYVTLKTNEKDGVTKILFNAKNVGDYSAFMAKLKSTHKKFDQIVIPMSKDSKTTIVDKEKRIFKNPLFLIYKLKNKEIMKISMTCLSGQ